jgi:hypothetical protein
MWESTDSMSWPAGDELYVRDLVDSMTVCVVLDPGQDESSDPDEFPPDSEKKPPPPGAS